VKESVVFTVAFALVFYSNGAGAIEGLELPRFGGHVTVLVSASVFPDFIDLTSQYGLPPSGGRSSGSMLSIAHAPARS
jgi:hypothetical protein